MLLTVTAPRKGATRRQERQPETTQQGGVPQDRCKEGRLDCLRRCCLCGGRARVERERAGRQRNVKLNSLSGGPAPASFVGFAETSASPPTCGEKWTSKPGTSSAPPATVPEYMEVVAASKITKSRSTISGNAVELVVVKTSPGYSPANKGTGKVVAVVQCT